MWSVYNTIFALSSNALFAIAWRKKRGGGREQKNYNKTGDKGKEKTMRSEFVLIKGF